MRSPADSSGGREDGYALLRAAGGGISIGRNGMANIVEELKEKTKEEVEETPAGDFFMGIVLMILSAAIMYVAWSWPREGGFASSAALFPVLIASTLFLDGLQHLRNFTEAQRLPALPPLLHGRLLARISDQHQGEAPPLDPVHDPRVHDHPPEGAPLRGGDDHLHRRFPADLLEGEDGPDHHRLREP